ncbi:MAG: hypothetical protein A3A10_00820 [Candidatus Tagabacteria bacterium RIFCSPLOWO2_01_FULL_42_9]|uniref:Uncharacterized protein n=1 Tax=Candidatus Tagabacteria bacterium RIFCSPLOWO2_01_FULL_42_9 TaxID=1802296 RepID=A0A1G2LV98_9BACT|nr:MAG: hypothetical protein A3A10_00820 [Candidatus Tagabacteria bacterium RIFCSPLOWO2_01_FULL_42_9]
MIREPINCRNSPTFPFKHFSASASLLSGKILIKIFAVFKSSEFSTRLIVAITPLISFIAKEAIKFLKSELNFSRRRDVIMFGFILRRPERQKFQLSLLWRARF